MKNDVLYQNTSGEFTYTLTAGENWKMVISYIKRYEVIGVIIKNVNMDQPCDIWLDLDQVKSELMRESKFGELNFVEDHSKEIVR
jgi:hypothetical protein